MWDNGRNFKDQTIERLIREDLKFESSSPEELEDSIADCFQNLKEPKFTSDDESIVYNIEEEIKEF